MAGDAFVLDSFAILAYLQREPGSEEVRRLLNRARAQKAHILVNQINIGEVYYMLIRKRSAQIAATFKDHIEAFPWTITQNDMEDVLGAAEIKASFPIAYADAFAAWTAQTSQATLVTGDPEFRLLEARIKIRWLSQ